MEDKLFLNRQDSALQLIDVLPLDIMKNEDWIVLSASNGGMPIAKQLATQLNAPVDIILTHKIFTPNNNKCEIAIISETKELVIHEELQKSFDIKLDIIFNTANELLDTKIKQKANTIRDTKEFINLNNNNILIVDEGLNTGLTMMACIKTVLNSGAKSVCVAVPTLPRSIVIDLESIADDLYFVKAIDHYVSINFYYEDLEDISIDEVKQYIKN
jgi:putative phosphoribosyl transferase